MRNALRIALCLLIAQSVVYAKQIVCVISASDDPREVKRIRDVAEFYGIATASLVVDSRTRHQKRAIEAIADPDTFAAALTPEVLRLIDKDQLFRATRRKAPKSIPLLVAGINEKSDPALLRRWSSGGVIGSGTKRRSGTTLLRVGEVAGVTDQLSGTDLPVEASAINYLDVTGQSEPILSSNIDGTMRPLFIRTRSGSQELFFSSTDPETPAYPPDSAFRESWVFGSLAAEMIFLKYSGGQYIWHGSGHYGNLTIDDTWLREPYGNVQYHNLLKEMQKHNFHTTIAFIPWNFDRSEADVATLFRANPDRFSISVHGNNHDHKEFDTYDQKSLSVQVANVAQSLARMEKFHQLTRIPYDPVMVFPHSIAPEPTLAALKRYNFIATVNSQNVPLGAEMPEDLGFELRPATLHFANFSSLRRYSAEAAIPDSQLAIDAFLGNPLLFYVHQAFFGSGINAFDSTADRVNNLQPDTKWAGLGEIAEHLYLEKERNDGSYDIRAFSSDLRLENPSPNDRMVFLDKEEDFSTPFSVSVDGRPYSYERAGNHIVMQIALAKNSGVHVTIRYASGVEITKVGVSKSSFRVRVLRTLSDFRDNVISRTALGRTFVEEYTNNEDHWNQGAGVLLLITLATAMVWAIRCKTKKENKGRAAGVVQSIN